MRYIFKLLLALLFITSLVYAQEFKKPDFDPRLSIDSRAVQWYNDSDIDSGSAFNIGLTYQMKIRNLAKAEFWYKKALSIDNKNIDAIINLGVICEDTKRYDEAIKWYEKAIERE